MSMTALITGGTSGIGRAVANKLAQLGIHVVVVGRNEERGEKAVAEFVHRAGTRTSFRLTCGMHRVRVKSRVAQSQSETAMSIS